jgi:hypothetical protein
MDDDEELPEAAATLLKTVHDADEAKDRAGQSFTGVTERHSIAKDLHRPNRASDFDVLGQPSH